MVGEACQVQTGLGAEEGAGESRTGGDPETRGRGRQVSTGVPRCYGQLSTERSGKYRCTHV